MRKGVQQAKALISVEVSPWRLGLLNHEKKRLPRTPADRTQLRKAELDEAARLSQGSFFLRCGTQRAACMHEHSKARRAGHGSASASDTLVLWLTGSRTLTGILLHLSRTAFEWRTFTCYRFHSARFRTLGRHRKEDCPGSGLHCIL